MRQNHEKNFIWYSSYVNLYFNRYNPSEAIENNNQISTYKDVKEWRYKIMNGRLYKRLFNLSKEKWETDWILVQ